MATVKVVVWDNTEGESPASMSVPVVDGISVANAQTLIASLNAVSIGSFGRQSITTEELVAAGTNVRPASELAQKENRFRVQYQDNTTLKLYGFTVPAADLTLLPPGSEYLDLTAGVGLAIKTDFELYGRSELGNAITVISIKFVTL